MTVPSKRWCRRPSLEGPVQLSLKWGGSDYQRWHQLESAKRRPDLGFALLGSVSGSQFPKRMPQCSRTKKKTCLRSTFYVQPWLSLTLYFANGTSTIWKSSILTSICFLLFSETGIAKPNDGNLQFSRWEFCRPKTTSTSKHPALESRANFF